MRILSRFSLIGAICLDIYLLFALIVFILAHGSGWSDLFLSFVISPFGVFLNSVYSNPWHIAYIFAFIHAISMYFVGWGIELALNQSKLNSQKKKR